MEKYQSSILHHWDFLTSRPQLIPSQFHICIRNTRGLSVGAQRGWFVQTHCSWPGVSICHQTAGLYSKYSQWISFLPSCPNESCLSFWTLLPAGTYPGWSTPGQGKSLSGAELPASGSHSVNNSPSKYSSRPGSLEAPATGLKVLLKIFLCCGAIRDSNSSKSPQYPMASSSSSKGAAVHSVPKALLCHLP